MDTNVIPAWHYKKNYLKMLVLVNTITVPTAKFHACTNKCTIHLKFWAMLPDYFEYKFEGIIILYCFDYGLGIYRWKENVFKKYI